MKRINSIMSDKYYFGRKQMSKQLEMTKIKDNSYAKKSFEKCKKSLT